MSQSPQRRKLMKNMKKIIVPALFASAVIAAALLVFSCGQSGGRQDLTDSVTDPGVTTAAPEGPAVITGWFDYGTALYRRDKFTPGTADSVSIEMAKNEIEGFQYLMTSDRDVSGLRCDVTELSDGNGNKLVGTVNVVWYTYLRNTDETHPKGFYPVAFLPMDDEYQGGSFDIAANTCRTLYVQYKTTSDTLPGTYTGKLTVSREGNTVLSGDVSLRVRDVYLEEKTECLTLIGLGYDKEDMNELMPAGPESAPPLGHQSQGGEWDPRILLDYANFLLENRMSGTAIPFEGELLNEDFDAVKAYMDNPRLTCVNLNGLNWTYSQAERSDNLRRQYAVANENGWVDKIYFGSFDEPHEEAHMQTIISNSAWVKKNFPTTNFLDSFFMDLPSDGKNIIERMSAFTTVYCPKIQFFRDGIKESMLKLKAERGDTLFWYVCSGSTYDTINRLPCTPGTDKRLLFWMQYQQNVDGFLYWRATCWNRSEDTWDENYMKEKLETMPLPRPGYSGTDEGVMIYWHPVTKQPVSTLGFEAMRDGIEDFQLLKMAEAKFGREKALEYASQLATDVNKYVRVSEGSTGLMMNLRTGLFDILESEQRTEQG